MATYLNSKSSAFFPCGVCGAEVPHRALVCPECGADERTGLHGDEDSAAALDLPESSEAFSYDDFMRREFGLSPKPHGLKWYWWLTGILMLAWFLWQALH